MQGSIPIQQVAIIILHFRGVCQVYFSHTSCAVYIPQAKAWGFDGRALNYTISPISIPRASKVNARRGRSPKSGRKYPAPAGDR